MSALLGENRPELLKVRNGASRGQSLKEREPIASQYDPKQAWLIRGTVKIYNNYSMSPSWIWSDKITNERVARVGYNHFISNKGEWNNCFSKFSNRVWPAIFISTILQRVRKENLAHYFPYDVKLGLLAHSRSFLDYQNARNAIVGAENLLKGLIVSLRGWTLSRHVFNLNQ